MRCFLAAWGLLLCVGCTPKTRPQAADAPTLRLAVVTDLKGYLEPCGCTSNPLGGIDRLAAQVQELRDEDVPLVLLAAGDVFFDASPIEPARLDQARRNAKTLVRILNRLQVDAVLPGERDRGQSAKILGSLRRESDFPWLAMKRQADSTTVRAGEIRLAVVGAKGGADREQIAATVEAAGGGRTDLAVVLVEGSRRAAQRVGAVEGVDFIVLGGLDQDAPLPPRRAGAAWVLHASRQGQGLTVVDVFFDAEGQPFADRSQWSREERAAQLQRQIDDLASKIDTWEKSGDFSDEDIEPQRVRLASLRQELATLEASERSKEGNAFVARFIELPKTAPRDPEVARLMLEHDKAVNQANRLAFADWKPPPLGPDDVAYVGSAACSACHQPAYAWWRNHSHGAAYLTLQQRHKEYNLDCVGCHVTGYGEPGGSTVTHNLDGALVGVGCESCHGPGAAHVKNPEVTLVRVTPESTCITCHNEEHSDLFDYEAYVKTLTVPGHGLPVKTPGAP